MSQKSDDLRNRFMNPTPEDRRAFDNLKFEHGRVGAIMRELGLNAFKRDMWNVCKRQFSSGRLHLEALNEMFPKLPVRFGSVWLEDKDWNHFQRLPMPLVPLRQQPYYTAFTELLEKSKGDPRPVALIVRCKGVPGGLVLHTSNILPHKAADGGCIRYIFVSTSRQYIECHLDYFRRFLKLIRATGWHDE